jgi:hypothetical protein
MKKIIGLILMSLTFCINAAEWMSIKEIAGVRTATEEEKIWLAKEISGTMIAHNFEDSDFLIYDGDLTIPSSFIASGDLVVRGNLTIEGMYDDDITPPYGFTIVLGNMRAENIYSWHSLHVKGDLDVSGLVLTIFNDFNFSVYGKLNAKGLIVDDKPADFNPGKIDFSHLGNQYSNDNAAHKPWLNNALRQLLPEFFSQPDFRDPIYDSENIEDQPIDSRSIRKRLKNGQPILRDTPGPQELPEWIEAVLDMKTSESELLSLINKDPLVNQLMAARSTLSKSVKKELAKTNDPITLEWLRQLSE